MLMMSVTVMRLSLDFLSSDFIGRKKITGGLIKVMPMRLTVDYAEMRLVLLVSVEVEDIFLSEVSDETGVLILLLLRSELV